MANFKIGDQVEVLDELISGSITGIQGDIITIETTEGLSLQFTTDEIIRSGNAIQVTNYEAFQIKKEKEKPRKKKVEIRKGKERNTPKMEVDLHIHQLTTSTRGMSNFDILNLQLDTAKRQLEFAIKKRIQKVVFIHGVGEGVLNTTF